MLALDKMCAPIDGWFFISEYSSGVSAAFFCNIASGIPILPTSWKIPPTLKFSISSSESPSFLPSNTANAETLSEWPLVYTSFA